MQIDPLGHLASSLPPALEAGAVSGSPFKAQLDAARSAGSRDEKQQVREAAEKLVASAFILPLLEQVREQKKENDPFYGGMAEDLFGAQMDTMLADDLVKGSRLPLVDGIYQQILRTSPDKGVDIHG